MWPFRRKVEVQEDPYSKMAPEEQWGYLGVLDKEADAWRKSRLSALRGHRGPTEVSSVGDLGVRYSFEDFRGAYRDFLEEFVEAGTQEDKVRVFNKSLKGMMAKGWTRRGATKRLVEKLIEHGLVDPEELGLHEE